MIIESEPSEGMDSQRPSDRTDLQTEIAPWRRRRTAIHLESKGLLWLALLIEASLSLSLSNTIFNGEATYIMVGRAEISHLLHGTTIPGYSKFISGAANVYPILSAAIDSIGGLRLLRLMSLFFMLLTTMLIYSSTKRIFGWGAATLGAGAFALAGPIIFMGELATNDAMTMFLLSLAIWYGVRGSEYSDRRQFAYEVASGAVAAIAVLTTYSGLMFVPSVAAIPLLYFHFTHNLRKSLVRIFAPFMLGFLAVTLEAWRHVPGLIQGLFATAINPLHDSAGPIQIVTDSLAYEGPMLLLGLCGVTFVVRHRRSRPRILLALALLASGLVSPLWHMHLRTAVSLQTHDGYGLLFVAPLVGVALSGGLEIWHRKMVAPMLVSMVILASLGSNVSAALYEAWPNSTNLIHFMSKEIVSGREKYLVEEGIVPEYYFANVTKPNQWVSTFGYTLSRRDDASTSGLDAFEIGIRHSDFMLIALSNGPTKNLDLHLEQLLAHDPSYELMAKLPYVTSFGPGTWRIWIRKVVMTSSMNRLDPPRI